MTKKQEKIDKATIRLRDEFPVFRDQCIWLQTCYDTYAALFENGPETEDLMSKVAPLFFEDLNAILIEYCLLQVCKLTDQARTSSRDNLTVERIDNLLKEADLMTPAISNASNGIAHYRNLIKDVRNRIIGHADKATIMSGQPMGEHAASDVSAFFKHLYTYVDEVGRVIGIGPLDFTTTSCPGDVLDLLRVMKTGSKTSRL